MKPVQLMIAGAQKGGTSSLHYYLSQHPDICTHDQLEMMYFAEDSIYAKGYRHAFERYFHCENDTGKMILAKNVGIMYLSRAMQRLYKHNPDVQIIISLRNPVDRAYSAYWYARRNGWEDLPTFEDAIQAEPTRLRSNSYSLRGTIYLDRSLYAKHLSNLFEVFDRKGVDIVLLDELKHNPNLVCQNLFNGFGIDQRFSPDTNKKTNRTSVYKYPAVSWLLNSDQSVPTSARKFVRQLIPNRFGDQIKSKLDTVSSKDFITPPINEITRSKLIEYFKPLNLELSNLINRDLSIWDN